MRILALFPLLIIFVLAAILDAAAYLGDDVIDIWRAENWVHQVLSVVVWLSAACAVWWLL
jgi:hypothetical protein